MRDIKIIGIAGTNGAGKDTIGQILADDYNFLFISVSEILRDDLRAKKLPIDRQNLHDLSATWRRESGLAVLVDRALAKFEPVAASYAGLTMASLRNPSEADRVHELGGRVIWVDAQPQLRYRRVQAAKRGRDGEDNKTFEQFLAEEAAEMHPSGDEATLNTAAVRAKSDIFLTNNDSLARLKAELDRQLRQG